MSERRIAEASPVLDRVGHPELRERRSRAARASDRPTRTRRRRAREPSRHGGAPPARSRAARRFRVLPRPRGSGSRRRAADPALARRRRARARAVRVRRVAAKARRAAAPRWLRCASPERSSTVRSSASNAARPGSYGMETVTSARAESASRSAHSAPVRSSNPYANTGSPDHAPRSPRSRSTACRRRPSRSRSPSASSSSRYAAASAGRSPSSWLGVDESRLELADRLQQRVGESGGCRRRAQLAKLDALRPRGVRRAFAGSPRRRARRPRPHPRHGGTGRRTSRPCPRAAPGADDQVALDPIDVDPVRYDEPRIMLEHREIALQKQRNLADVRRPGDERETHRSIVVLASGALSYAPGPHCAKSVSGGELAGATAPG